MRFRILSLFVASALALQGCDDGMSPKGEDIPKDVQRTLQTPPPTLPKPTAWTVASQGSPYRDGGLLWNGLVGARVGVSGNGNGPGHPFGGLRIDAYEKGGEEKIKMGDGPFPFDSSPNVFTTQTMDFKRGWIITMLGSRSRITALDPLGEEIEMTDGKPGPIASKAEAFWADAWKTDIDIDGPVEDQLFLHSVLYYLRSAIHPDGQMSISPFALSNTKYNGHVFWDADVWVFPALCFVDPIRAARIPDYRLRLAEAYAKNAVEWKPSAAGAIKVPWESSVSGKETAPPSNRMEDHITGTVAFSLAHASALGLADDSKVKGFIQGAAKYYALRSEPHGSGAKQIKQVMSPDENHTGDNDLYTNLLAQWTENQGAWSGATRYYLPKDDRSLLTYDGDKLRGYKQAAAVLSIYPLQYPDAEKQAQVMMDRFSGKTIENGPAMSDSVHALIWARLGKTDKAYETWHNSWKPFMREPFMQFSEKRKQADTYFTTGAAGSLQAVIYGFLGLRVDKVKPAASKWSTPLRSGYWLSVNPHLPKEWKSAKFKGMWVLGKRYDLSVSADNKVTVKAL